ncbi:MAG: hypothetical protein VYC71_01480, partial [Planctomycetota bacterium]|nr:hypothetical protein [Planctomycetota bacterium]
MEDSVRIGSVAPLVLVWLSACAERSQSACAAGFERAEKDLCKPIVDNETSPPNDAGNEDSDQPLDGLAEEEEETPADGDAGDWLVAPARCEAPEELPTDPVLRTRYDTVPGFAHVIDVAYSDEDDQFYVAGIPALTGWRVTETGLVETVRYDM